MPYAPKKVMMHADAPEKDRDQAGLLKEKMEAEYVVGQRDEKMNRMPKRKGAKMLRAEFKKGKESHPAPVASRASYRAHILAHSLFPNVFNKHMVMTHEGAS